jgi:hypothetical protein
LNLVYPLDHPLNPAIPQNILGDLIKFLLLRLFSLFLAHPVPLLQSPLW